MIIGEVPLYFLDYRRLDDLSLLRLKQVSESFILCAEIIRVIGGRSQSVTESGDMGVIFTSGCMCRNSSKGIGSVWTS